MFRFLNFSIKTCVVIIAPMFLITTAFAFCPTGSNCYQNPYGSGQFEAKEDLPGRYTDSYSNYSMNNSYATKAPKLYDEDGNYRGRLSNNTYDPDSISNPYGRYGNKFSNESPNNPYGAGNPYGKRIFIVPED